MFEQHRLPAVRIILGLRCIFARLLRQSLRPIGFNPRFFHGILRRDIARQCGNARMVVRTAHGAGLALLKGLRKYSGLGAQKQPVQTQMFILKLCGSLIRLSVIVLFVLQYGAIDLKIPLLNSQLFQRIQPFLRLAQFVAYAFPLNSGILKLLVLPLSFLPSAFDILRLFGQLFARSIVIRNGFFNRSKGFFNLSQLIILRHLSLEPCKLLSSFIEQR